MKLHLDSSKGFYGSRVGLNMYSLPTGEYAVVYELYFPSSIDISKVQISAVGSVETVSRVSANVFSDHSRSIFHTNRYNNVTPNYLMIDMHLENKSSISYTQDLQIFVVVYGVSVYQNNVATRVCDKVYEIVNSTIKFQTPVEMTGELIALEHLMLSVIIIQLQR